jgi:hypothetical protein
MAPRRAAITWSCDWSWLISVRIACLLDSVGADRNWLQARASSRPRRPRAVCSSAIWPRICREASASRAKPRRGRHPAAAPRRTPASSRPRPSSAGARRRPGGCWAAPSACQALSRSDWVWPPAESALTAPVIPARSRSAPTAALGSPANARSSPTVSSVPLRRGQLVVQPFELGRPVRRLGRIGDHRHERGVRDARGTRAAGRAAKERQRGGRDRAEGAFGRDGHGPGPPAGAGAGTKTGTATVSGASLRPSRAVPESSQV